MLRADEIFGELVRLRLLPHLLALTLGLVAGCTFLSDLGDSSHCVHSPCPQGYVCSKCTLANNGCVPLDQKDVLHESCLVGGTTTGATDGPTSGSSGPTTSASTTETSSSSTTGATDTTAAVSTTESSSSTGSSTTMPLECDPNMIVDEQCTPLYCLPPGVCGSCENFPDGVTCASLDPTQTVCDPEKDRCVECTQDDTMACGVDKPACDPGTGQCTQCTEHFECPDTACDIETGHCFPPENVYYVKNANGCIPGQGTLEADPLCVLGQVPLQPGVPTTIKIIAGGTPPGALAIPDNHVVAVVAAGAQIPDLNGANNLTPTISVGGPGSRVYLSRLKFRYGPTSVLKCQSGAAFYAHDVAVEGDGVNKARAIEGNACTIRVRRGRIERCGAGIQVTGGDLRVESSYLIDNGFGNFGAFEFINDATAHITYTTVVLNHVTMNPSTFACTGAGQNIVVRNSAVIGLTPMSDCMITQDGGMMEEVADATAEMDLISQWFTPMNGIYPPKSVMNVVDPLEDKAMWGGDDPRLDYKRGAIPQDVPTFAGAEQPPGP